MNDWEKDDPLWQVLGHARTREASPYFSRRVLSRVRTTERPTPLLLRWIMAGSLACLVVGFVANLTPAPQHPLAGATPEFLETFDAAAGIDTLVATADVADFFQ